LKLPTMKQPKQPRPAKDLPKLASAVRPQFTMRTEPHQLQIFIIRLAANED
jgi:hypothetical protein